MSATDMIQLSDGAVQVDAAIIAAGLALELSVLRQHMREQGVDEDQGRYRLTFFFRKAGASRLSSTIRATSCTALRSTSAAARLAASTGPEPCSGTPQSAPWEAKCYGDPMRWFCSSPRP